MFSAAPLAPVIRNYGNPNNVKAGAIRWDAWYTATTVATQMEESLGPDRYHWRAPWFATVGSDTIEFPGTQATMDQEIVDAVYAGLDYFAFVWYASSDEMRQGWTYFQASPNKSQINWCFLFSGWTRFVGDVTSDLANTVARLSQANYQTVITNRPLVFIFDDGSSETGMATAISDLRTACSGAGIGNPYIVIQNSTGATAHSKKVSYGADAISAYAQVERTASKSENSTAYRYLVDGVYNKRVLMVATGSKIIPVVMGGWNRNPRIENPVSWEPGQLPGVGLDDVYVDPTAMEFADHLQENINYVVANSSICEAGAVLIYAWNEHDEGGWICPTYNSTVRDSSKASALRRVLV